MFRRKIEAKPTPIATEREVDSPESRRQRLLLRIGVLLPLLLLGITLTRGASEKKNLPAPLLGVWQTSAEDYADCSLEITPARIVFGNAERGYTLYFVSHFEQDTQTNRGTTVVYYTDLDGEKYEMSLVYSNYPRETLQFKNQPKVVWEKRPNT